MAGHHWFAWPGEIRAAIVPVYWPGGRFLADDGAHCARAGIVAATACLCRSEPCVRGGPHAHTCAPHHPEHVRDCDRLSYTHSPGRYSVLIFLELPGATD